MNHVTLASSADIGPVAALLEGTPYRVTYVRDGERPLLLLASRWHSRPIPVRHFQTVHRHGDALHVTDTAPRAARCPWC